MGELWCPVAQLRGTHGPWDPPYHNSLSTRSVVTSSSRVVFPSVILAYEQQVIELMAAMSAARSFAAWLQSYFNVLLECLGHLYSIVLHINKKNNQINFQCFWTVSTFTHPWRREVVSYTICPTRSRNCCMLVTYYQVVLCVFSRYRGLPKDKKNTNTFKSNALPVVNTIVVCDWQTRQEWSSRKSSSLEQHETFPHRHGPTKMGQPLSSPSTDRSYPHLIQCSILL